MKKVLALIFALCLSVAFGSTAFAAEDDGIRPYNPGNYDLALPFAKIWNDNGNALGLRPTSITVNLYRYIGEEQIDEEPFYSIEVEGEPTADEWNSIFVVDDSDNKPAFYQDDDKVWHAYDFKVTENPIKDYSEDESLHKNPVVVLETPDGGDNWKWITPNSTTAFPVYTEGPTRNFIAAKKGNQLYIWTPEPLSELEAQIIVQFVESHNQFPQEPWDEVGYFFGYGHYADGGFTMTAGNPGSIAFDDHSKWSFWARGTYTVSEPAQLASRIANKPETVDVTITKKWDDGDNADGIRPSAEEFAEKLVLKAGTTDVTEQYAGNLTVDDNEDGTYTCTWKGLPKNGLDEGTPYEITYTVEESAIDEYTATGAPAKNGDTITNKHEYETIDVRITKKWVDGDNADKHRPSTREFAKCLVLMAGDDDVTEQYFVNLSVKENDDNTYTCNWTKLPKNKNGTPIEYLVKESPVPEYYDCEKPSAEPGENIVNTHDLEKTTVNVSKSWDDGEDQDGLREGPVTVQLYADGEKVVGKTLVLSEGNGWQSSFKDLPKNKASKEIEYTVKEEPEPAGYTVEVRGNATDGYIIVNTHEPYTVDISVAKEWADNDNKNNLRPDFVTVQLYADGEAVAGKTLTLDKSNDWKGAFTGLPKNKASKAIEYTVKEEPVPTGYSAKVSGSMEEGFTIANECHVEPATYNPSVEKVIKGNPKTPADFTFQIKALDASNPMPAGAADGVKAITGKGAGSFEFGEIAFTEPGTYSYEITEIDGGVANYTYDTGKYALAIVATESTTDGSLSITAAVADQDGNVVDHALFTNEYKAPENPTTPTTGDSMPILPIVVILVVSGAALVALTIRRKQHF